MANNGEITRIANLVREGKLSPEDAAQLVESLSIRPAKGSGVPTNASEPEPIKVVSPSGVAFDIAPSPPRPKRVRVSAVRDAEERARTRVPRPSPPIPIDSGEQDVDLSGIAQNTAAAGAGIAVGVALFPILGPFGAAAGAYTVHLLRKKSQ